MSEKVRVYVPHEPTGASEMIDWLSERLAEQYGGSTVTPASVGRWEGPDGDIVKEPVAIVESTAVGENARIDREALRIALRHLRATLDQEEVMAEITESEVMSVSQDHLSDLIDSVEDAPAKP